DLYKKVKELLDGVTDEHKKELANKYENACKKVFGVASRKRRDFEDVPSIERFMQIHSIWLTQEQKDEISELGNVSEDILDKKIDEFFETTTGETRRKAIDALKSACRQLIEKAIGEDNVNELSNMKISGKSLKEIEARLDEFIGEISDEYLKDHVMQKKQYCVKIYKLNRHRRETDNDDGEEDETIGNRRRRHEDDSTTEGFVKNHLFWLTDEQKEEFLKLKDSRDAMHKKLDEFYNAATGETKEKATESMKGACRELKLDEFYNAATGETKEKATESMKGACRELVFKAIGEERTNEIKAMKESGKTFPEIEAKIEEYLKDVTDEKLKGYIQEHSDRCRSYFKQATRMRRHRIEEDVEDLETVVVAKELPIENFEEPKVIEGSIDSSKVGTKTRRHNNHDGDHHDHDGHQHRMRRNDDEENETDNTFYEPDSRIVDYRRKRDHHHGHGQHKIEDYLKTHLSWLTVEQGDELKKMEADKKSPEEMQKKIFEFYDAAEGETKTKATELLQGGCRELLQTVVGEEKANEIKALKESGATKEDLYKKVKEFLDQVTDEHKKELANKYESACKKVFGVASRKRRDHHDHHSHGQHTLEDYLKTHLSWLTVEQAEELKKLKADGKTPEEIQQKVFAYYDAAEGETKTKATELLQGGCRELVTSVIGEEKANEIKAFKDTGASNNEVAKKVFDLVDQADASSKKELVKKYESACKKVYGVATRKRREEEGNKFESEMRSEGKTGEEMQNKLFEYYDMTDGDLKQAATESLQNACRDLLGKVLEPAQSEELKSLKASGKSIQELSSKVEEFLKDVEDENKKELIQKYSTGCKRVFGLAQSRKRRNLKPKLTHIDFIKAVIGNENLPELTHQELSYKIMDVYDAQTISETAREIVNQCHHMFAETVSLGFYMADYSARELLHSLRSASNRQLSSVAAIAELCTQAIKELKSTEGRHGSVGDTLIKLFNELDDETKQRLGTQWRSRCSDWIVEITDEEERSFLRMLFRTQQFEILRERINEFISRFDDTTRTEVGHMRPICEQLLGLTHHGRKFYQRRIPVEEVF
uniref:Polyprotein allergen nematode domain-containing protein n=1 Tax=Panagrolaimus sp. JU765 TaxID=591449 RepID=A0AC34PZA1_9BILA